MKYLFLFGAIAAELIGAIATRQSSGFTKPLPSIIAVLGVVGAYFMLSLSLKSGMTIGVAYGIWAALGITLLVLIGVFFFKEPLSFVQVIGIILIVSGVLALELGKGRFDTLQE
ncbi:multidrug efflux SMR transporter [Rapidithrix thailandica]|uniref:Multidrug efflux SMR transporter n=1 Tax=Rapidithrix thailandica TaxID=413964 RepID=A0AAW9SGR8_9BACT